MSSQPELVNVDVETEIQDANSAADAGILGKHLSSMMGVPRPLQNSTAHSQSKAANGDVRSGSGSVLGLLGRENPVLRRCGQFQWSASVEQHLHQDGFSEIIVWLSF